MSFQGFMGIHLLAKQVQNSFKKKKTLSQAACVDANPQSTFLRVCLLCLQ